MSAMRFLLVSVLVLCVAGVQCAPFFDAIYDVINGNSRRSYGYSGYGNYGYDGYSGYGYNNNNYGYRPRNVQKPPRQGKTYKEICRVHYPDALAGPGAAGVMCPF